MNLKLYEQLSSQSQQTESNGSTRMLYQETPTDLGISSLIKITPKR